jgi:hypothetical protein
MTLPFIAAERHRGHAECALACSGASPSQHQLEQPDVARKGKQIVVSPSENRWRW